MRVTIGQCTVIFVTIPLGMLRAPYNAVPFEFVDTEYLVEFGWPTEVDGLKDRLDGVLGDRPFPYAIGESERLYQVQGNEVIESLHLWKETTVLQWLQGTCLTVWMVLEF